MVHDGPWPAAGFIPEEHPEIFWWAGSYKQQATSGKLQAASNLTRYPIYCRIKTERKHMITQKQYNEMLDSFNDKDWKNIRRRMEEKLPETKLWSENLFRSYCTTVVRSGFRKEGLNWYGKTRRKVRKVK